MTDNNTPAARIAAHFGGQNALARALCISQGTVWGWINSGRIPYSRIPAVVAAAAKLDPPVTLTSDDFIDLPAGEEAA